MLLGTMFGIYVRLGLNINDHHAMPLIGDFHHLFILILQSCFTGKLLHCARKHHWRILVKLTGAKIKQTDKPGIFLGIYMYSITLTMFIPSTYVHSTTLVNFGLINMQSPKKNIVKSISVIQVCFLTQSYYIISRFICRTENAAMVNTDSPCRNCPPTTRCPDL